MNNISKYLHKRIIYFICTFIFLVIVLIITYNLFINKNNFQITYTSGGNKVNILNYIEEDITRIPNNIIKLKNTSNTLKKITLKVIEDNNYINNLNKEKLKYMINNETKYVDTSGILDYITLKPKEEKSINIKIWIDWNKLTKEDEGKRANLLFYISST